MIGEALQNAASWLFQFAFQAHARRAAKEMQHAGLAATAKSKEALLDQAAEYYRKAESAPGELGEQYRKLGDDLIVQADRVEFEPGDAQLLYPTPHAISAPPPPVPQLAAPAPKGRAKTRKLSRASA